MVLTNFNRGELVTLVSQRTRFQVVRVLSGAGIAYASKTNGMLGFGDRNRTLVPGMNAGALYTYTVYVHKQDEYRALKAIRDALHDEI